MQHEAAVTSRSHETSVKTLLLVVVSAIFITTFTGGMINVALPVIRAEFGASPALIGWIVTGYLLAYAVGVPILGRASDRYGVRRLFVTGLAGFAAGGIVCALAPSLTALILGRTLQGCAGAAVPALATVAVAKALPPGRRGAALGLTGATVGIGSSVGPVAGGALMEWLGWRGLFAIPITLALILIPLALRSLPDGQSDKARPFDAAGGLLLAASAGLFLLSITQGQVLGFRAVSSWGSLLAAGLAAAALAWRSRRVSHPFIPRGLFRNRTYVAALLVGPVAMFTNGSALVLVPLLVVEVNGLASSAAGMVLTPQAVAVALLSPITGRLSDRIGVRKPILTGLAILTLVFAALSTWAGAPAPFIAALMVGLGIGAACLQSPANNAAANALDDKEVGAGMGLFSGTGFLLAAAGPALSGALLAARAEAGQRAVNPLYQLSAAPFSDVFLALLLPLLVAWFFALRLPPGARAKRGGTGSPPAKRRSAPGG